jgi:hypothetical protein
MSAQTIDTRPKILAIWLVIAGVIGWIAAFALTLEKFDKATGSTAPASCDFSVVVQCSANLDSAQGSVFGFPTPSWASPDGWRRSWWGWLFSPAPVSRAGSGSRSSRASRSPSDS